MAYAKNEFYLEEQTLENLRSYQNIIVLASTICEAPMAFIKFGDCEQKWFKANAGMEEITEALRNISFCTDALKEDDILEVTDTQDDARFSDHPNVMGAPFIRFYAGAQIKSEEGFKIGTLCVAKLSPFKLSDSQRNALRILANQVSDLLKLNKLNHELAISKRKLEERQELLVNKARHQTIGELAGGVCHQINNPLAIIVGRSMILRGQLRQQVPNNEEFMKELDVIDNTAQRVSGILKALRTYSKEMGEDFSEANLSEVIDDAITLMRGKLNSSKVELVFNKGEEIIFRMNKNQIGQVILDLLSNSIESLEESLVKKIFLKVEEQKNIVVITLEDTGEGVAEDLRMKIFEPFFSTKPRHFGVGLSNARSFILQHRGEINLLRVSSPTTFEVKIPKIF